MTARERRLFYAFCAIILIALTWFVIDWRDNQLEVAEIAKKEAKNKLDDGKERIEDTKAELEAKRHWLETRNTQNLTLADASSELLNRARLAVSTSGLELEEEKFLDVIYGVEFDQARMSCEIQGSEKAVYSALVAFHDPDRLQVLRGLRVQPVPKTKGQIIATAEFRLYYRPVEATSESLTTPPPVAVSGEGR